MFYAKCANHTIFLNYAYVTLPKIIGNNTMLFMTTLITMEKELKFKKEWFDVLSRCDRNLRTDVVEAVLQYFFTGAEPNFTDDASVPKSMPLVAAVLSAWHGRSSDRRTLKPLNLNLLHLNPLCLQQPWNQPLLLTHPQQLRS